jgi:hypothetical protein
MNEAILIILFIYILILYNRRNVYEYFSQDYIPDERNYMPCPSETPGHEFISDGKNQPSPELKGFFSSLKELTGETKPGKHYQHHNCSGKKEKSNQLDIVYDNKVIDHQNNEEYSLYYDYFYHNSKADNNFSVLYPEIFHDSFLKSRDKIMETDDRF